MFFVRCGGLSFPFYPRLLDVRESCDATAQHMRNTCATHLPNIIVQELPHFGAIPAWRWLANWRTRRQPRWGRRMSPNVAFCAFVAMSYVYFPCSRFVRGPGTCYSSWVEMRPVFQPFPMLAGRRAQAWHYQPAYRRPKHFHGEPEINLVTRGRGTIQLGEREIKVRAGSLVWFPPGLDHYLATASQDFELLAAGFQPELMEAYTREHGQTLSFARPWQQLHEKQALKLAIVLGQAHEASDPQSVEQRSLEVLRMLLQLNSTGASRLGHRAASFIVSHPTTSRDRLAHAVGSNRGDISRQFHRDLGMTLRQYRNVLRTLALLRLSNGGTCNLAEVALQAGFGSYSQCHRVFRSLLGVSPREFVAKRHRFSSEDEFEPLAEYLIAEERSDDDLPTVADLTLSNCRP